MLSDMAHRCRMIYGAEASTSPLASGAVCHLSHRRRADMPMAMMAPFDAEMIISRTTRYCSRGTRPSRRAIMRNRRRRLPDAIDLRQIQLRLMKHARRYRRFI